MKELAKTSFNQGMNQKLPPAVDFYNQKDSFSIVFSFQLAMTFAKNFFLSYILAQSGLEILLELGF